MSVALLIGIEDNSEVGEVNPMECLQRIMHVNGGGRT